MKRLTVYRDDSTSQVVYDNVKHYFLTGNNTVLTIAQITDASTGAHRYIHLPLSRVCWWREENV